MCDLVKIRRDIVEMSYISKAGHIPSALSMVDYVSILFKKKYVSLTQDRIVIGKPYGAQAYYATFKDIGLLNGHDLFRFGKTGSILTHGITSNFPGIDFAEETLGSCLGVACGLALSMKNNETPGKVYVNISDASLQAGTIWEAIMFASTHNLESITMTVDYNKLQILGTLFGLDNLESKFKSFGWRVIHEDGHESAAITKAYNEAFSSNPHRQPTVILFDTVKGKGISFMEGDPDWHYKVLDKESCLKALGELV